MPNGFVREGQTFETDDERAQQLEAGGLAERVHVPLGTRVSKMLFGSPENKAKHLMPPMVIAPKVNEDPPDVDTGRRRR
jgi:hypothetical protein